MPYLLLALFALLLAFIGTQFFSVLFLGSAPFGSTSYSIIKALANQIEIKPGDTVYELGAGNAPFLLELHLKQPQAKFVGYENSFLPWLIGQIQSRLHKAGIKLYKQNLFRANLADASLIYCYLNTGTMAKLEQKFKAECRPGTRIISLAFPLPNTEPAEIKDIEGNAVYFYVWPANNQA